MRGFRVWMSITAAGVLAGCVARVTPAADEAEARAVVETFGSRMQLVSLLSPQVEAEMRQAYAELVDPPLLDAWIAGPASAPGRLTSSPWPDRIEIQSIEQQATGRLAVSGQVIELTSAEASGGGAAVGLPVSLTVDLIDGRWVITTWEWAEETP